MSSIMAFFKGIMSSSESLKVFDWDKAVDLIRAAKPKIVYAGLKENWGPTADVIYKDGNIPPPTECSPFLLSTWATPVIEIDGQMINCWLWEGDSKWGCVNYWPYDVARRLR